MQEPGPWSPRRPGSSPVCRRGVGPKAVAQSVEAARPAGGVGRGGRPRWAPATAGQRHGRAEVQGSGAEGLEAPPQARPEPWPKERGASTVAARDPASVRLVAGLSFLGLESTDRGARPGDPEPSLPGTGSSGPGPSGASRPALRWQPDENQRSLRFVQKSRPTSAPTVTNGAILAPSAIPSVPASRDGEGPGSHESRLSSRTAAAGLTRSGCAVPGGTRQDQTVAPWWASPNNAPCCRTDARTRLPTSTCARSSSFPICRDLPHAPFARCCRFECISPLVHSEQHEGKHE
jgi:hypothetical protein